MIEEETLALLHLHQIELGGVIAHAGPWLSLGALLHQIVPGEHVRFGLHQPIRHRGTPLRCRARSVNVRGTIAGKFRRAKREGDMKIGGWIACALLALTSLAQAQQFPTRPVTLIVPWPAGGSTDI